MSTPTFDPPENADFAIPQGYEVNTVQTPTVSGRSQARARWSQALRHFKLRWEDASPSVVRYLVGFFTARKGPAETFRYLLEHEPLYWPEWPDPVETAEVTAGALGARTYYVAFSWANSYGETRTSTLVTVSMSANKVLKVTVPEFPRGATSAKVYVGTSPTALKLEATITDSRGSWTEDAAGLAGTGASPVTTSTFQENLLCRFGQEVFTPEHTAADLATCELLLQEVSES